MSDRLKALRENRGKVISEMRGIVETAETAKRELTGEESAKHAEMFKKQEELRGTIGATEKQVELDREMAADAADADKRAAEIREIASPAKTGKPSPKMAAFRKFLVGASLSQEEARDLEATSDTKGGYTVPPEEFLARLILAVDNAVFMRRISTKFTVANADSLGVPTLDTDPSDPTWTVELDVGSADSAMVFGKRALTPNPLAKYIKVSKKLLRASALPIENIVLQRLAYKFAVAEEQAFMTGSGVSRPLGIFTASADGITTARDYSTGNTTSSITFDGLIGAKYTLKAEYWNSAQWVFHRDAMSQISKLKDGEGQYLWRESVRDGEPDRVLGRPINISEYASNTFTTGLYVGVLGDFSQYWIVDALMMQVQRLVELYALTNQDAFIGRIETDGAPVLAEAFVRVKLG